jgi:hypothetical protein
MAFLITLVLLFTVAWTCHLFVVAFGGLGSLELLPLSLVVEPPGLLPPAWRQKSLGKLPIRVKGGGGGNVVVVAGGDKNKDAGGGGPINIDKNQATRRPRMPALLLHNDNGSNAGEGGYR